ncbi:NifU family protein [Candidatus Parcubacteria bacterium]|nr:NifU family protein [Patescibacteria group bacterium]MBU4308987.1 NifU family protein [Patescibacteria group bacterium]MBU4431698.1 NifU family protein [Patescibacteria group bacterium]MBU4577347.1 NifU family protein [Patescibacteria group bacterium]MCG2697035.1 NifU family protein [Candidatus Parcubacteria bacterium]
MSQETIEKIKQALEIVRPSLQMDGGDVQFVNWNEKTGILEVALMGMCTTCPMSQITLKQGIEVEVQKLAPEVLEVKAV